MILRRKNKCYDLGAFGWALKQPAVASKLSSFSYFILLNSSVRGPFIPVYVPGRRSWHQFLTQQLQKDVHMVGPSISCGGLFDPGRNAYRSSPHVQTWLLALDETGLEILIQDQKALKCHEDRYDAIWDGEVGSSMAILKAGYNIGSFLEPYQGIDWRLPKNHKCNSKLNPMHTGSFLGGTLSPYATMFTKFKQYQPIDERSVATSEALLLSTWMMQKMTDAKDD